ncbi:MAG: carboxypeptidase regulatory-like domain-containing protein, partial [bacterium]|nr:carboxypeptidase regulatory-like domain-containing protein [bacterium]
MKRAVCAVLMLIFVGAASAGEWHTETVDSVGMVGQYTSLALDDSDYPHISYFAYYSEYGYDWGDLKYALWNGSSWQIQTVDWGTWGGYYQCVGMWNSLALDSSGARCISYLGSWGYPYERYALTYAKFGIQPVDDGGVGKSIGFYTSLALDSGAWDRPHISYYDGTNGDLKYASWNGSSWLIETVDSAGAVGLWTSLALDDSDYPHISYYDFTNHDLKYARWNGSSWQIQTVDSEGQEGECTSLALDDSDYPHISYYDATNSDLKYAWWDGDTWQIELVDLIGWVGSYTSLALDSSGRPHISYYGDGHLKYASWNGSSWWIETVYSAGSEGTYTSLALDSSDRPHISYYDYTNSDL